MGGARNLKMGRAAGRGKGQGIGGNTFLCVGQMSTLFSFSMQEKRCSRVQESGAKPPEAKTLLAFGRAMEGTHLPDF